MAAEQKANIARYFVLSSPVGEVEEVVKDVKTLVDDPAVVNEKSLGEWLASYHVEHMTPIGTSIICSYGQVGTNEFLEPATGRVVAFDPLTKKVNALEKKQVLDEKVQGFRTALEKEISMYATGNYKKGKATAAVFGADTGNVSVAISAINVNLSNFWTGGWRSSYVFSVTSGAKVDIKASVNIQVHYFEDGNVQLHLEKNATLPINVSSEAKTAAEARAAIEKFETDLQNELEATFVRMHDETFKAMRRFYPVTKQPMEWNLAAHNVAENIGH